MKNTVHQVNIRLDAALHRRLKAGAVADKRKLADFARILLEEALDARAKRAKPMDETEEAA